MTSLFPGVLRMAPVCGACLFFRLHSVICIFSLLLTLMVVEEEVCVCVCVARALCALVVTRSILAEKLAIEAGSNQQWRALLNSQPSHHTPHLWALWSTFLYDFIICCVLVSLFTVLSLEFYCNVFTSYLLLLNWCIHIRNLFSWIPGFRFNWILELDSYIQENDYYNMYTE